MEEFDDIPTLEISLHWPHDRFAFGWDILQADEKYDYATINFYLGIITITYNKI